MARPTVYIDASIPSYYYEQRDEPILRARHLITLNWWDTQRQFYELFVSEFVLAEIQDGDYPHKHEVIDLLRVAVPTVLPLVPAIESIAETLMDQFLMPQKEVEDSFHLAFAAYYKMDFLLTWNCRHLANANKQQHMTFLLTRLRLFVPAVVTPEMLFREELNDDETLDY